MKTIRLFLIGIIAATIVSCTSCSKKTTSVDNSETYSAAITSVKTLKPDTLNTVQLDSLTKADNLPLYAKWEKTYVRDGETLIAYEYATLYDKETGVIYTVKYLRDKKVYVVQKKKTTKK